MRSLEIILIEMQYVKDGLIALLNSVNIAVPSPPTLLNMVKAFGYVPIDSEPPTGRGFVEIEAELAEARVYLLQYMALLEIDTPDNPTLLNIISALEALAVPLVEIGGYLPITTGEANVGSSAGLPVPDIWVLQTHALNRIRQAGPVLKIDVYFAAVPDFSKFVVGIARDNGDGTWRVLYSEDFLTSLGSGAGTKHFNPSTQWVAEVGDAVFFNWAAPGGTADFFYTTTVGVLTYKDLNFSAIFSTPADLDAIEFPATGEMITQVVVPMKVYSSGQPYMMVFGDSLCDGTQQNCGGANTVGTSWYGLNGTVGELADNKYSRVSHLSDPCWLIGQHFGWTNQNMSCGAEGSVELAARVDDDIAAYEPTIVITDLGVYNDVWRTWLDPERDNDTARAVILDAIVDCGATPVVVLGIDTSPGFLAYEADIKAMIASSYPTAIVIDVLDTMCEDGAMKDEYLQDDAGWHLTQAGIEALVAEVIRQLTNAL